MPSTSSGRLAPAVSVKADFDGDGKTDFSVWRGNEGNWYALKSSTSTPQVTAWGTALAPFNDVIVPGDYDGDGKADLAVWRPADGVWYVRRSSTGTVGLISAANSLVGTRTADRIGITVARLTNGNYVVSSPGWDNPMVATDAGAVTWGNGAAGMVGPVTAANSLIGGTDGDQIGSGGLTVLANGHYLVYSNAWDNPAGSAGPIVNARAVTLGNGAGGTVGLIDSTNSFVGTVTGEVSSFSYDLVRDRLVVGRAVNNLVTLFACPFCGPTCPTITLASLPAGSVGQNYVGSVAASPTGTYSYTLMSGSLPPGLTLYGTIGLVYGYPTTAGSYNFTLKANEANGCGGTRDYTVVIGAVVVCSTITLTDLPVPSLNTAYNQSLVVAPAASYSFTVTAGALPTGLSLNPTTGAVTGTPTAAGPYSFTIRAADTNNCAGSRSYSGTLASGSCGGITLAALASGGVGQLYVGYALAAPTGSYTYALTAGSLPPGLTLYGTVGLLYGYPTAAGTYNFTITATGTSNCAGMRSYTVVIN
ncbi:MAG: putative Ig domain-containing protein [Acidobacteria bacterium]|nr:putative Ig domain-containing protein [Acidobacteriota bacterium]MBI3428406.1 putative Ig domain-containing protein [Acidobacteriota bacterium]